MKKILARCSILIGGLNNVIIINEFLLQPFFFQQNVHCVQFSDATRRRGLREREVSTDRRGR